MIYKNRKMMQCLAVRSEPDPQRKREWTLRQIERNAFFQRLVGCLVDRRRV